MSFLTNRVAAAAAVLAVVLSLLLVVAPPASADVSPARIDGVDRYDTAAIAAEITFSADRNSFAFVARADDFPDALAGAGAAGSVSAPILLVDRDEVPARTAEALQNLTIQRVIILGGETVISADVEAELEATYRVDRIGGEDRYDTAARIADFLDEVRGIGPVFGDKGAILASGQTFADALTAGPLAYSGNLPILLTRSDALPSATVQALQDRGIERVLLMGGTAAISQSVEDELTARGIAVDRFAGETRTDTARLFADALVDTWGYSTARPMLAFGGDFPDGLAAGPRGGAIESPILLTRSVSDVSEDTRRWLRDRCPDIELVQAVGGRRVITAGALGDAVDAAETCLTPQVVGEFETELLGVPNRTHNIQLAAQYVDGDVIPAGASYSLDANIGPRTTARGFRVVEGGCIGGDGEPIDCVGGGISQFITTFMNAAWFTGIDIPEFHQHSIYFRRYPVCHEGTIVAGVLDLVVRNNSPYRITIDTYSDDDVIGVRFLSQPWAEVESWSNPTPATAPDAPFNSSCGRTITYPDGSTTTESYTHFYEGTGF